MAAEILKPADRPRSNPLQAPARGRPVDPERAWAPYVPDAERPWTLAMAAHLYRRAAFGADWGRLQQAVSDGPQRSVEKLLRPADAAAFNRTYDEYETSAAGSGSVQGLRAWWLRRMIHTPHPLLERMTLFWHNHFAISNAAVNNTVLMHRHVQLLRRHALGSFQPLLEAVACDPAVLVGLGAAANRKARPSRNYARQLMERFSLGPGQFSEQDVAEVGRAFTGWFVFGDHPRFIPREHDPGTKSILGREGNFEGRDVVRILLEQPATPRLLVRKLYRWFVSETEEPTDAILAPLAESLAADYDVGKLVETMLRSNLFFSPAAYRRRIKSPVEFALGIVRALEGAVGTTRLASDLARLGQNLYHPPTVQGWPGGRHWINHATLIGRSNLVLALLSGSDPYGDKLNPLAVARKHGHTAPESVARFLLNLFLQGDLPEDVEAALLGTVGRPSASSGGGLSQRVRAFAHAVVTLPEFQLA